MITIELNHIERCAEEAEAQAAGLEKEAARLRGVAEGLREGLRLAIVAINAASPAAPETNEKEDSPDA